MHWHAYLWNGIGEDRGRESERRPASPDFAASPLPPMRTGDWLAKPTSRIAGDFSRVEGVVEWMRERYLQVEEAFLRPDPIGLEGRLSVAADLLERGVDVQWGEWLKGGRFITIGVVCCPNRHTPHPCPTRSR